MKRRPNSAPAPQLPADVSLTDLREIPLADLIRHSWTAAPKLRTLLFKEISRRQSKNAKPLKKVKKPRVGQSSGSKPKRFSAIPLTTPKKRIKASAKKKEQFDLEKLAESGRKGPKPKLDRKPLARGTTSPDVVFPASFVPREKLEASKAKLGVENDWNEENLGGDWWRK